MEKHASCFPSSAYIQHHWLFRAKRSKRQFWRAMGVENISLCPCFLCYYEHLYLHFWNMFVIYLLLYSNHVVKPGSCSVDWIARILKAVVCCMGDILWWVVLLTKLYRCIFLKIQMNCSILVMNKITKQVATFDFIAYFVCHTNGID